uniref:Tf2-1-like SH3-like domain-containing protein n=1 Tax=Periophthalmus magnuspinnatus TaxID=409849 RepID=A0A3B3ZD55_9GOBI
MSNLTPFPANSPWRTAPPPLKPLFLLPVLLRRFIGRLRTLSRRPRPTILTQVTLLLVNFLFLTLSIHRCLSGSTALNLPLSSKTIPLKTDSRKLSPRFLGPFKITKVINPSAVQLHLPPSLRIHPTFHVSQVRPVRTSDLRYSPLLVFTSCPVLVSSLLPVSCPGSRSLDYPCSVLPGLVPGPVLLRSWLSPFPLWTTPARLVLVPFPIQSSFRFWLSPFPLYTTPAWFASCSPLPHYTYSFTPHLCW